MTVVFAGLVGGIIWNLGTWLFGIPSSSSHALIGGVIGATIAAAGGDAIKWKGLFSKVIIPAGLSPIIALGVAAIGTWLIFRISRNLSEGTRTHGFRIGQIGSASMVSLAHGTNDAQKTMGVITLALIANGSLPSGSQAPFWVILSCALAISIGTYTGGWRVIRTLGKGLVEIDPPQGMGAESASAAIILLSSHFGYSLSTTHVATGSILGVGVGKKGADVRWNVAWPDGHGLVVHAALRGPGRGRLRGAREGHPRSPGRAGRPGDPDRHRGARVHAGPPEPGRARQRQRRVERIGRSRARARRSLTARGEET